MNRIKNEIKKPEKLFILSGMVLLMFILTISCNTMSYFDSFSYKETISAKVDALDIMSKATKDYKEYAVEVNALVLQMKKIYEYEKNRPKNTITAKMWEILINPDRNLFGGFIKRWENEGKLNPVFITEMKIQVEEAFGIIIDLENNKIKKEEANKFISNN